MQLFYDPEISEGPHRLREEEARHAVRVLRKRPGDVLDLVDGRGGWYRGEIIEAGKRDCTLEVERVRREEYRAAHRLTLAIAPTKQIDRFEWILEKATEIGVDRIVPILTEHSERDRLRIDRLERVLESAMKQSLRAWIPELAPLTKLDELLDLDPDGATLFIAYLGDKGSPLLANAYESGRDAVILVGPEGGFSPAEADRAGDRGFTYCSLGPNRLRTETAAIAAVHTIEMKNW